MLGKEKRQFFPFLRKTTQWSGYVTRLSVSDNKFLLSYLASAQLPFKRYSACQEIYLLLNVNFSR